MTKLIGALVLTLVLAASYAEATCAWVLWIEETWLVTLRQDERQPRWTLVQAEATEANRKQHAEEKIKALSTGREVQGNLITRDFPGSDWIRQGERMPTKITELIRVLCVPDTIDPRGPKAGGR